MLDPRWLTLKEAAHYSSIGEARLVSMAKAGDKNVDIRP